MSAEIKEQVRKYLEIAKGEQNSDTQQKLAASMVYNDLRFTKHRTLFFNELIEQLVDLNRIKEVMLDIRQAFEKIYQARELYYTIYFQFIKKELEYLKTQRFNTKPDVNLFEASQQEINYTSLMREKRDFNYDYRIKKENELRTLVKEAFKKELPWYNSIVNDKNEKECFNHFYQFFKTDYYFENNVFAFIQMNPFYLLLKENSQFFLKNYRRFYLHFFHNEKNCKLNLPYNYSLYEQKYIEKYLGTAFQDYTTEIPNCIAFLKTSNNPYFDKKKNEPYCVMPIHYKGEKHPFFCMMKDYWDYNLPLDRYGYELNEVIRKIEFLLEHQELIQRYDKSMMTFLRQHNFYQSVLFDLEELSFGFTLNEQSELVCLPFDNKINVNEKEKKVLKYTDWRGKKVFETIPAFDIRKPITASTENFGYGYWNELSMSNWAEIKLQMVDKLERIYKQKKSVQNE